MLVRVSAKRQEANVIHLPALLRLGSRRRKKETYRENHREPDLLYGHLGKV